MEVALEGSSPAATTAGIMLLTRARQLGLPLRVVVVGDADAIERIPGPAVLYAPVLASCGIGREAGSGAMVVMPGPPGAPLLMTATPHGVGGWFYVDRTGNGAHPATQAFVRLSRDTRVPARHLGKDLRRAMQNLGMSPEPAVLDVLFGADVPPLTRLSLALRAGRSMSGGRGQPITRYVSGTVDADRDPLPPGHDEQAFKAMLVEGELQWVLDGLSTAVRDRAEEWLENARLLALDDGGRDLVLVRALAEIASHLVQLPPYSILPPLGAAEDSVAVGLKAALAADEEEGDANLQLARMFKFLGGRYVPEADHVYPVADEPPPTEHIERWKWFCSQIRIGRKRADALWPHITDRPN